MADHPPQEYVPLARLRLILRLDEFGATDAPKPPDRPPQLRTGKGRTDQKLAVVERDGRLILLGPEDTLTQEGGPQAQVESADLRTHAIDVVPVRISISRNGIRTADTMSATVRFADLPVDPRTVRACAVQAFVGCVDPEQAARLAEEGKSPVLPDEFEGPAGERRSNLRFTGWVDEWETEFAQSEVPTVRIECTDNARLLIEQEAPPKLAVAPDKPIDRAVADYLSNFPQFRGLAVEYRPAGSERPKLSSALGKAAHPPKLGPGPKGDKLNIWDYLTDVCGALGHVCTVDDLSVVIQRVRTLYGSRFSGRPDDPFRGRDLASGRHIDNRLFVYGLNVQRPRIRRKFARVAPANIEVRCFSPAKKRTLVVRFPAGKGDRLKKISPGGAADQTWRVFTVQGIESEEALRTVAQGIYESVGRNELEAEFETRDLASVGGDWSDPDALDCKPGDAIDLETRRDLEPPGSAGGIEAAVRERPIAFLRELGFDESFAGAYAEAVSNAGLTTLFRVRTSSIDWDNEEGVRLAFVAVNYVEVRADKALPGEEEGTTTGDESFSAASVGSPF